MLAGLSSIFLKTGNHEINIEPGLCDPYHFVFKGMQTRRMMNLNTAIWASWCILMLGSCTGHTLYQEEGTLFNDDWLFLLADDNDSTDYSSASIDTGKWEHVSIPHTPRIEPLVVNDQWQGTCWYRKEFSLPRSWKEKKIFLKFEGAMNVADVWINGQHVARHQGGYLPFVVELTACAAFNGDNVLAVRLDNRDNPVTGPKPLHLLDFNTYGGIYRNVHLFAKPLLHITDPVFAGLEASGGVFVTFPDVSAKQAVMKVQTHVYNTDSRERQFRIVHRLYLKDKLVLTGEGQTYVLHAGQDQAYTEELMVRTPALWSPEHPALYRLESTLEHGGNIMDRVNTSLGIKWMEFHGQQFYLNGNPVRLMGVNRHQEYPFIGYALSDSAQYREAFMIREAGFNYVRLSHYPHSPAFMEACDQLGILTIDAIPGWQYFNPDTSFRDQVFQTVHDLIRRDRNHPSVLAWEVSLNESWMPEPFIDSLVGIAHREYPGNQCFTAGWQDYAYDIYLQARQHRLHLQELNREKPYVVSEYGDWEYYAMNAGLNQDRWADMLPEERSSRQLRRYGTERLMQQATNIQEAHNDNLTTPAFADGYWVMFDYNRGYSHDLESSGIMDIFRIPKPAYYFFQSQRPLDGPFGGPMAHITEPTERKGRSEVLVFSNCEEVELWVDGKSLGRTEPFRDRISDNLGHPPFRFVMDEPQFRVLEAFGFIDGNQVTRSILRNPGQPRALDIRVDLCGRQLQAASNDVIFVHACLVDSTETIVPANDIPVSFQVSGPAELIGDNPANLEAGIASILLRAGSRPGKIYIRAISRDMAEASLELESTGKN